MTDRASLSRYRQLIEAAIGKPALMAAVAEDSNTIQIDRAVILPALLTGHVISNAALLDPLLIRPANLSLHSSVIVDSNGHRRPVYRPLLIYCWLLAMKLSPQDPWKDALHRWCLDVRLQGSFPNHSPDGFPAVRGSAMVETVWGSLVLHVGGELFGESEWIATANKTFACLCEAQQPGGAFLKADPAENPETTWYHELVLLHAVASFSVHAGDVAASQAAARSAAFHLEQTQPDHATSQPWGLLALILHAPLLADQLLHAVTTQHPSGASGVSLLLMADVLYSLRQLERD